MTSWGLTVAAYLSVLVAAVALEVLARLRPDVVATFGRVLTWSMRRRSTQLLVALVWWWSGWHFVTNR